jgi:hypothetical protein
MDNPKPEGRQYLIFANTLVGQREKITDCILEYQKHHHAGAYIELLMHQGWSDHVEPLETRFKSAGLHCILLPVMQPSNAIVLRSVG